MSIVGNVSQHFHEVIHERRMCYFENFLQFFHKINTASEKRVYSRSNIAVQANRRKLNPKVKTNCIFVDFREAFNAVVHKVLLEKMSHISIRGI